MAWSIWFTGLPGSGKTVIAEKTRELLEKEGVHTKILELDQIRRVLTPTPKYSEEERDIVYSALAYMAMLLVESGVNVIIDATANKRKYRDLARKLVPNFAEIYIRCPLEVCIEREGGRKAVYAPKDIYMRAKKPGATVPGVDVPYEESLHPEVVIDSDKMSIEEGAQRVVEAVQRLFEEKIRQDESWKSRF